MILVYIMAANVISPDAVAELKVLKFGVFPKDEIYSSDRKEIQPQLQQGCVGGRSIIRITLEQIIFHRFISYAWCPTFTCTRICSLTRINVQA